MIYHNYITFEAVSLLQLINKNYYLVKIKLTNKFIYLENMKTNTN